MQMYVVPSWRNRALRPSVLLTIRSSMNAKTGRAIQTSCVGLWLVVVVVVTASIKGSFTACGRSLLNFLQLHLHLAKHLVADAFALQLPFTQIRLSVAQVLVAGGSKASRVAKLLSQGNNIVLKEPNLALVPSGTGVVARVALHVRIELFLKQATIVLLVDTPVLHAVCHVGRLDDAENLVEDKEGNDC